MPDVPVNTIEIIGILVLILLYVVKLLKSASPPTLNGALRQLSDAERRLATQEELSRNLEKQLGDLHQKASDAGDKAQRFINEAMDRFVSIRECDRRHNNG